MKPIKGFENAQQNARREGSTRLPIGAYVCKIKNVRYINGENGYSDAIEVLFDIVEGDQKDFFKNQYDANTSEDKKWKGRKLIYVPKGDGSEKDGWTENSFAKWTNAFEDSNSGYKWDWDEGKWKGLTVGIVFGETGTVLDDGKEITYTEPRFACSVDKVRTGNAPAAKFVAKNGYTGNGSSNSSNNSGNDFLSVNKNTEEDIPF